MSKTEKNLYQCYEEFHQGLVWKDDATDETKSTSLAILQQFLKFLIDNEWKSGVSTRRDQFAMAAMQGFCSGSHWESNSNEDAAKATYETADAMIEESEK